MAWTTSAGPRGEFALAAGAAARALRRGTKAIANSGGRRYLPVAAVTLVHAATLIVVAPRIAADYPLALLVVLASLAISIAMTMSNSVQSPTLVREPIHDDQPTLVSPSAVTKSEIHIPIRPRGRELSPHSRNDLMARVSHELRTPLNAVVGFSDLMGHELFGPLGHPRYEEYVRHIRDSGQKLLKSTEDTLAITSLLAASCEAVTAEEIALASLARDARQIAATDEQRRAIPVSFDIATDIAVMAHRRALRQVFVNLIAEALSRSSQASKISVAARSVGDKVAVSVTTTAARAILTDGHASLSVCLARTLIELGGGELLEGGDDSGGWQATTLLDRAAQSDFFLVSRFDTIPSSLSA